MPVKNSIKKIILDFEYTRSRRHEMNITEKTSNYFYEHLLPLLDKILTEKGIDIDISIDKLLIDIGATDLDAMPALIASELEKQLTLYLSTAMFQQEKLAPGSLLENEGGTTLDVLLYLLRNGTLPWYCDINEYSMDKLLDILFDKNADALIKSLTILFTTDKNALQRFVMQAGFKHKELLLNSFSQQYKYAPLLNDWLLFLNKHPSTAAIAAEVRLFNFVLSQHNVQEGNTFFTTFVNENVLQYFGLPAQMLSVVAMQLEGQYSTTNPLKRVIKFTTANKIFTPAFVTCIKQIAKEYNNNSKEIPVKATDYRTDEVDTAFEKDTVSKDIYINNSGLVILAPYLQMFFTRMKLVDGEVFISKQKQIRAVQLLQYLITAALDTPEHLLPLCKVICGVPMLMPVPAKLKLTAKEKTDCEELLTAVIRNWAKLGNTSIAGLRETFLQRNGVLKKDDENWVLHVERKTLDVLLEYLPWSYNLLKFPWNEYIVHVQW